MVQLGKFFAGACLCKLQAYAFSASFDLDGDASRMATKEVAVIGMITFLDVYVVTK